MKVKRRLDDQPQAEGTAAHPGEDSGGFRKSIPSRDPDDAAAAGERSARLGLSADLAQEAARETSAGGPGQTEILTIVSFTEDEVRQVRESLARNGGRLLAMEHLDAAASQRVVLPFQFQVPDYRNISRGWEVRALVPAAQVEEFVASLRELPQLQLLERTQVPGDGSDPDLRNVQINLIRQSAPLPASQ